jgi:hypothetical protein
MMMLMCLSRHCCDGVVLLAPPSLRVLAGKAHVFPEHSILTVVIFHSNNLILIDTLAPPAQGQLGPVGHIEKHLEWQQKQTDGDTPTCSTQLRQCQSRPTMYLTIHVMTQLQNL